MKDQSLEIMAPVGSYEALTAAFQAGADSVYFGVETLNMRSHSSANFTLDDLSRIAGLCHEHRVKCYLTVNTVLYDNDLSLMRRIVDAARQAEINAIIACDVAAMEYACSKGVEVHLSTQLNISNVEALRFYARFADVVVLARELNLEQVAYIHEQIANQQIRGPKGELVRIEMFCHGALCVSISGKCYMSLHEMNASANRGACMQICRRAYRVTDIETGTDIEMTVDDQYILSPKDLKTIHFLNKLIDAGVEVFKIEGRARGPEYVYTVTGCYREAVEAYSRGEYSQDELITGKIADWDRRLSRVFNRGFWDGFYLGQRLGEWSHRYGSSATTRKVKIGRGTNYYSRLQVAEFQLESYDLSVGDEILVTGPTTGVIEAVVTEIRLDDRSIETARKGQRISLPLKSRIRPSDTLYKIVPAE
ncbi:MAG: U32 family peptidase [Bacteroidales bacterium]|nr:U32 family peptidase [Bacteroidales bacterium]